MSSALDAVAWIGPVLSGVVHATSAPAIATTLDGSRVRRHVTAMARGGLLRLRDSGQTMEA
jgi:hypothetical protein